MEKKSTIYIVGAGVSGLVAALYLEKQGYAPIILEASGSVGGRVQTDLFNGYQLDHGFQVLLEAYPKAKEYLDYDALALQSFKPGAVLYKDGASQKIGDPLRDISLLFPTLFASVGSLADKWKIFKLNRYLSSKTMDAIFKEKEITTLEYLQNKGFSDKIIASFFKPFFSGIFLETELSTSSRMFEFVYKMFGEGLATLPKAGIGAIPDQLAAKLERTKLKYDTHVVSIRDQEIILANGETLTSDYTIIATEASAIIPNLNNQETRWKRCENLYFEVPTPKIKSAIIGLVTDSGALINNIFYHDSIGMTHSGEHSLLSVTVVKEHNLAHQALVDQVISELGSLCNIHQVSFLKKYTITKALPELDNLQYEVKPSETQLSQHIFLAGDVQLNGSLNAAMMAGETAARGVLEKLEGGTLS